MGLLFLGGSSTSLICGGSLRMRRWLTYRAGARQSQASAPYSKKPASKLAGLSASADFFVRELPQLFLYRNIGRPGIIAGQMQSAVHVDGLAGDKARHLRPKESHNRTDIRFRLAAATQRTH